MLKFSEDFREWHRHIFNSNKVVDILEWVHKEDTWVLSISICTLWGDGSISCMLSRP